MKGIVVFMLMTLLLLAAIPCFAIDAPNLNSLSAMQKVKALVLSAIAGIIVATIVYSVYPATLAPITYLLKSPLELSASRIVVAVFAGLIAFAGCQNNMASMHATPAQKKATNIAETQTIIERTRREEQGMAK